MSMFHTVKNKNNFNQSSKLVIFNILKFFGRVNILKCFLYTVERQLSGLVGADVGPVNEKSG